MQVSKIAVSSQFSASKNQKTQAQNQPAFGLQIYIHPKQKRALRNILGSEEGCHQVLTYIKGLGRKFGAIAKSGDDLVISPRFTEIRAYGLRVVGTIVHSNKVGKKGYGEPSTLGIGQDFNVQLLKEAFFRALTDLDSKLSKKVTQPSAIEKQKPITTVAARAVAA